MKPLFFGFSGVYTAPYDGIYQFSAHLASTGDTIFRIRVNEVDQHFDIYPAEHYKVTTVLFELHAGDRVDVWTDGSNDLMIGDSQDLMSYFSGFLVFAN